MTRHSLQNRITTSILITFAAVALFFGAVFLGLLRMHTDALVAKSLMVLHILMEREAAPLANEIFEGRMRAIQLRVREILALDSLLSVTVYDRDGNPLVHADRLGGRATAWQENVSPPEPALTRTIAWRGISSLVFQAPVSAIGETIGHVRIYYSLASTERYKRLSLLALAALLATTFIVMLLILHRRLSAGVRRPIARLQEAMARIETQGPGVMVRLDRDDEIGDLTRSFNAMSAQLAELLQALQFEIDERKKAQEELNDRVQELLALNDLSRKLGATLTVDAIMDAAADHAHATLKPDAAMCFIRIGEELVLKAARPAVLLENPDFLEAHRAGTCLCGISAGTDAARYSLNIHDDPRCTLTDCKALGIVSAVTLPLTTAEDNMGVILIGYRAETDLSRQSHFLEAFSNEVAIALKNAVLYDQLRLSEEKFASAFRASPDAIAIADPASGTILEVNDSFERITGWTRDEAVGHNTLSLGLWEDPEPRSLAFAEIERHGKLDNMEFVLVQKSGDRRFGLISMRPIWLNGSRLIVSLVRDITQRKQAEEALRQSRSMLDSIIRSIPDILYRLDPRGRITFVNSAVERYGYSPEELIGCDIIDLIHPEDRPNVEHQLKERRSGDRKTRDLTLRLLDKNQRSGLFETRNAAIAKPHIMLVDAEGLYEGESSAARTFKGTQGIARDITQLKDLEDRLRQAQKMEAIGTLAGGIAHDFNNILGGIIGYSELALGVLPQDAEKLRKYLGRVLSSGRRAGDLVRQILQFARRGETVFAPIDVGPVLKETLKLMHATLPKTIAIETALSPDVGAILADPTQIHQVLMNLCTNAYHAMRESGGALSVSMDAVTLTEKRRFLASSIPPGRYVRVSVADTGPGIPTEIQERIFEPYFTTKKMNEGTGLGLSVSLGIIETHGGAIELESAAGKGTTFTVFLPIAASPASAGAAVPLKLPRGDGQKILFVDDEPFFLDAITEQLESLGYRVNTTHDGREALSRLQADLSAFDLVITDQTMPEITGVQLAGQIRKLSPDIPIILCTGYSETVTEETAMRFGISKFLMKPINREELAFAVNHALKPAADP